MENALSKKDATVKNCRNNYLLPLLFLISFSATVLIMPAAARATADMELPETSYGMENTAFKILVVYATRAGSTAEVADAIGKKLAQSGVAVDVKPLRNVQTLNGYQAVVLGSAIRRCAVLPELTDFVKTYKDELSKIPTADFIVCMIVREDTEKNRKTAVSYLDPLRAEVVPVDTGIFAGKLDYSKLGFIDAIIIKYFIGTPEGDLRDWQKINDWAADLLPKLQNINKAK
ncbi:MAG: flavodoxin domain-containing protein [Syntrophaceae bacterium]|nr:flavodoxin domain-containing protein [Syntrophaceae bacterium]